MAIYISTPASKEQDKVLMDVIEKTLSAASDDSIAAVARKHDRSLLVEFPDGRVVTIVLYGPKG